MPRQYLAFNERDPDVNDDVSSGWYPTSIWYNGIDNLYFICLGNDPGSAIWRQIAIADEDGQIPLSMLAYASGGGGGGGNITVGSSVILGGTTSRVLYDNAGVVGQYAISGTGSVAMTTSPTFVTPALGTPTSGNFSTGTFSWPTFNQNTTGNAATVTVAATGDDGEHYVGLFDVASGNLVPQTTSGLIFDTKSGTLTLDRISLGADVSLNAGGTGQVAAPYGSFTDLYVDNDVTVNGDLIVNGDTISINTSSLEVEDSLIELAVGNTANSLDIGFYGNYQTASTPLYTGIFWDASTLKYRLFTGLESEPTTTVNTAGTGYAVGTLVGNIEGTVNGVTLAGTGTLNISTGGTLGTAAFTAATAYQPVAANLTSWALITRASGFDTFAATPSSAKLASLVTDETGSGALVFGTSPTLRDPVLTNAVAGTITLAVDLSLDFGVDYTLTLAPSGNYSLSVVGNTIISGTNSGDQTDISGNAATATALKTARAIYGNNFDGTAPLTGIIASTYGGTGNGFFKVAGPAGTEKTFTFPNASATVLTSDTPVTVAQGGTGITSGTKGGITYFSDTAAIGSSGLLDLNNIVLGGGVASSPFAVNGISTDGTSLLRLGESGISAGSLRFDNATSGKITIAPPTGALGTVALTLPITSGTFYVSGGTDVAVADGGTGRSTGTTAYALIATGTTATGAQQTLASAATTEILVGGGASALPVWTTASGSGAPLRGTGPTFTGATGQFTNTGLTILDTNASHSVAVVVGTNITANRNWTLAWPDAATMFTLAGSTTITTAAASVLDDTTTDAMLTTLGGATYTGNGGLVRLRTPSFIQRPNFDPDGLRIQGLGGVDVGYTLLINATEDTDASLTLNLGSTDRLLNVYGDATLDQDVSVSGNPTFAGLTVLSTISGSVDGNAGYAGSAGSASYASSAGTAGTCSGNAATASALFTTRSIGGSNFNGTGDVTSFPAPGPIGGTTPAAGTFTTLVAGSTTSLLLGTAGSAVGNIGFRNATSGTATLAPPTGALGTYTITLPNAASTLPIFGQQLTFTGPTAARTVTFPDAAFTVARTDAANTFTGTQTFASTTTLLLGTAGSAVGNIGFRNATSGTATLAPPTGALGTYTVTLPNAASTLPVYTQQITYAGPTAARTVTYPDAAFTAARIDAAQTFVGVHTFTGGLISRLNGFTNNSVIGSGSTGGNAGNVYGDNGSAGTASNAIGNSTVAGNQAVAIGHAASANGIGRIAIGYLSSSGMDNAICIGRNTTANYGVVIGYRINDLALGDTALGGRMDASAGSCRTLFYANNLFANERIAGCVISNFDVTTDSVREGSLTFQTWYSSSNTAQDGIKIRSGSSGATVTIAGVVFSPSGSPSIPLGSGLKITEGSNATMGVATLVGGTVTVSTTKVTASSRIFLTGNSDGGTPGWLRVSARTAATSFTITSSSGTDTGTVAWIIMEPA